MIRGLILDFGGTIAYDEDPKGLLAARRDAAWRALSDRAGTVAFDAGWARMLARLEQREEHGSAVSAACAARDLVEDVVGRSDPQLAETVRLCLEDPPAHPQRLRLVEGAVPFLEWSRARGVACALLSNTGLSSGSYNTAWMRRAGVLPLFARGAVLFSDEIGVAKPDPAAFALCLGRLGCQPAEAVHVGDDLWFDVHGGREAGLVTARVSRFTCPRPLPDADIVVEDLACLADALTAGGLL